MHVRCGYGDVRFGYSPDLSTFELASHAQVRYANCLSEYLCVLRHYIHYSNPMALTVREMARLQPFDDSFVFQVEYISAKEPKWKTKRTPIEQVLEATPPLLARAIGMLLLNAL